MVETGRSGLGRAVGAIESGRFIRGLPAGESPSNPRNGGWVDSERHESTFRRDSMHDRCSGRRRVALLRAGGTVTRTGRSRRGGECSRLEENPIERDERGEAEYKLRGRRMRVVPATGPRGARVRQQPAKDGREPEEPNGMEDSADRHDGVDFRERTREPRRLGRLISTLAWTIITGNGYTGPGSMGNTSDVEKSERPFAPLARDRILRGRMRGCAARPSRSQGPRPRSVESRAGRITR